MLRLNPTDVLENFSKTLFKIAALCEHFGSSAATVGKETFMETKKNTELAGCQADVYITSTSHGGCGCGGGGGAVSSTQCTMFRQSLSLKRQSSAHHILSQQLLLLETGFNWIFISTSQIFILD